MFKFIKRWCKVKKMSRAIWRQVKIEQQRGLEPVEYTTEGINEWLEKNEFRLTRERLETHCISKINKTDAKDIYREIKCQ